MVKIMSTSKITNMFLASLIAELQKQKKKLIEISTILEINYNTVKGINKRIKNKSYTVFPLTTYLDLINKTGYLSVVTPETNPQTNIVTAETIVQRITPVVTLETNISREISRVDLSELIGKEVKNIYFELFNENPKSSLSLSQIKRKITNEYKRLGI